MSGRRPQGAGDSLVYALYQQGRSQLLHGNPRGAAEILELAVEHEPQQASLHEALGRAYFGSARVTRAREEFERALDLDPSDDYAHFGVGRCFERHGRLHDAAKHYKLACAMSDRDDYQAALSRVLGRLRLQAGGLDPGNDDRPPKLD